MTTRLPNAVGVWRESPQAGLSTGLAPRYWTRDAATSTWTLTSDRRLEMGRLTDVAGTGTYTLELLTAVPIGAQVRSQSRRSDGVTLVY